MSATKVIRNVLGVTFLKNLNRRHLENGSGGLR